MIQPPLLSIIISFSYYMRVATDAKVMMTLNIVYLGQEEKLKRSRIEKI